MYFRVAEEQLHFILPLLDSDVVERLLEERSEEVPSSEVQMEAPREARTTREAGSLCFRLKKAHLYLPGCTDEAAELENASLRGQAELLSALENVILEEVRLAEVRGLKLTRSGTGERSWKRISYVLQVPGGHVSGSLQSADHAFDELQFEQHFHTLRLVRKGGR